MGRWSKLGISSFDLGFAVEQNEQWFVDQYNARAGAGITADEWFNHHHTATEINARAAEGKIDSVDAGTESTTTLSIPVDTDVEVLCITTFSPVSSSKLTPQGAMNGTKRVWTYFCGQKTWQTPLLSVSALKGVLI
jgi:hypothetical protein